MAQAPPTLTDQLLSQNAARYTGAITSPTFFHRVLNGTVSPGQVAYFFEQDTVYGRGFTTLAGQALGLLSADLHTPTSNRTLTAIDNMGKTASGLADEDRLLTDLRDELDPGGAGRGFCPSEGTLAYVNFMKSISSTGSGFAAFVCSWTMGKAFVDAWQNIEATQKNKPNSIPQLQQIIEYWADPTYAASIDATKALVNEWYASSSEGYATAESVFLQTLDAEDEFWRGVDAWEGV